MPGLYLVGISMALDLVSFREFFPAAPADAPYFKCLSDLLAAFGNLTRESNAKPPEEWEFGEGDCTRGACFEPDADWRRLIEQLHTRHTLTSSRTSSLRQVESVHELRVSRRSRPARRSDDGVLSCQHRDSA